MCYSEIMEYFTYIPPGRTVEYTDEDDESLPHPPLNARAMDELNHVLMHILED